MVFFLLFLLSAIHSQWAGVTIYTLSPRAQTCELRSARQVQYYPLDVCVNGNLQYHYDKATRVIQRSTSGDCETWNLQESQSVGCRLASRTWWMLDVADPPDFEDEHRRTVYCKTHFCNEVNEILYEFGTCDPLLDEVCKQSGGRWRNVTCKAHRLLQDEVVADSVDTATEGYLATKNWTYISLSVWLSVGAIAVAVIMVGVVLMSVIMAKKLKTE